MCGCFLLFSGVCLLGAAVKTQNSIRSLGRARAGFFAVERVARQSSSKVEASETTWKLTSTTLQSQNLSYVLASWWRLVLT